MSSTVHNKYHNETKLHTVKGPALVAAVVGLAACGYSYTLDDKIMLGSYLYALMVWVSLTLGCFGITLLHHVAKGKWGLSLLRIVEAGGGYLNLLAMGALFTPILMNLPTLYKWAIPEVVAHDPVIQHKAIYLNVPFFIGRTVFFFLAWALAAFVLRQSSVRQDTTKDEAETAKRTNIATPMLVFFVLSITSAITDWVMSLDPHWFSTMYGVWFLIGCGLMTMSFCTFILCANKDRAPYKSFVNPDLTKDLGNFMFMFTMLWGYTSLSQYLIIWSGNLPEFISYYVTRREGFWNVLGAFNIFSQFFFPFILLLAPRTKAVTSLLIKVAAWIFIIRMSDLYWNIIPDVRTTGFHWTDIAALVGVGGVWFFVFGTEISKAPLTPQYDDRLNEVAHH